MKKVFFLASVTIALFIIGCKKDSSDDDGGSSQKMQLITSAAWIYDTAAVDLTGDEEPDQPLPSGTLKDCDRDNIITLNDDGTGTVDEGATKCDAGDPQSTDISWSFKNNETVINIPDTLYGNISGDAKIKELTATRLTLVKQIQITDPITMLVNVVVQLKH
jgi:hypothetical protein